jgi:hypothetical protein
VSEGEWNVKEVGSYIASLFIQHAGNRNVEVYYINTLDSNHVKQLFESEFQALETKDSSETKQGE